MRIVALFGMRRDHVGNLPLLSSTFHVELA